MTEKTDLIEILNHINPGLLSYEEWCDVGMALKYEGRSADDWESWSMRDPGRYHPGECAKKWKSFKGSGINRLSFAIYTYEKPDILLFDEKFVFGNKNYTARCKEQLKKQISDPDVTFVMSANRLNVAAEFCTRGIILNDGVVEFDGSYEDASAYYLENIGASASRKSKNKNEEEAASEGAADESDNYADDDGSGMD